VFRWLYSLAVFVRSTARFYYNCVSEYIAEHNINDVFRIRPRKKLDPAGDDITHTPGLTFQSQTDLPDPAHSSSSRLIHDDVVVVFRRTSVNGFSISIVGYPRQPVGFQLPVC